MDRKGLIDAHCHLEWKDFNGKLEDVIRRARNRGLIGIITDSALPDTMETVIRISESYPGYVFAAIGFAPSEVPRSPDGFNKFLKFLEENVGKYYGIGEVGLDYYWVRDKEQRKQMEEKFIEAMAIAEKLKKVLIIHSRDAEKRVFELIEEHFGGDRVHIHCYSGDPALVERGVKNGWYFSVPASVMSRKVHKKLAEALPVEYMMLETDAPFLSPRKNIRPNEPYTISYAAEYIAELKNIAVERLIRTTAENTINLYGLPLKL